MIKKDKKIPKYITIEEECIIALTNININSFSKEDLFKFIDEWNLPNPIDTNSCIMCIWNKKILNYYQKLLKHFNY